MWLFPHSAGPKALTPGVSKTLLMEKPEKPSKTWKPMFPAWTPVIRTKANFHGHPRIRRLYHFKCGEPRQLRSRRTNLLGVRKSDRERCHEQALRQEATDAVDSAGRSPALTEQNAHPRRNAPVTLPTPVPEYVKRQRFVRPECGSRVRPPHTLTCSPL